MKALALSLALLTSQPSTLPACDALDAACLKLHLDDQLLQIRDLSQKLASTTQQLDIAKAAEQAALNAAKSANDFAQKIQAETKSHWYEAPSLWLAVGFVIASAISIGLAAAFAHVTR